MANPEHLAILEQGELAWNTWREKNPEIQPDLSRAELQGSNLSHVNLAGANLAEVRLAWAELRNARLMQANLRGAKINDARLPYANLSGADLNRAYLWGSDFREADFSGADLTDADLRNTQLARANFEGARLVGCKVYGISAWELRLEGAEQSNLIITPSDQAVVTVDNLEVAQFIFLLLNNSKIRDVINTITTKAVLILGRFTPERKAVLDAIRAELGKRNYVPILFDFDPAHNRDLTETVTLLARMSRFIIADLTDPRSIPLELQAVAPDVAVPVQPVLLRGQQEFSLFADLRRRYHWVLATHQYQNCDDLLASLGDKVIGPAEQKAQELERR